MAIRAKEAKGKLVFSDRKKKPRKREEAVLQEQFFNWLKGYPEIRALAFAIPNGGSRNAKEGASLKRQGVTPGVPDVFMAIPGAMASSGLFLEFKSKKGKLSKQQEIFIKKLANFNYEVHVSCNLEETKHYVRQYLRNGINSHFIDKCRLTCIICNPDGVMYEAKKEV